MINTLKNTLKEKIENALCQQFSLSFNIVVEEPKSPKMGDLSIPIFSLIKVLKKPMPECAEILRSILQKDEFIQDIELVGGFINLRVDKKKISSQIIKDVITKQNEFGTQPNRDETVVIDYSSPNIAKPFSIGHLRSTIIGNSLRLIYKKLGYNVVGINHLGDWGTQFGKVIVAYQLWGDEEKVKANSLKELALLYVRFHDAAKTNPELEDKAREAFRKLEQGDSEYLRLWSWFREESLKESMNMYKLLDVEFDSYNGEAFFNDKMEPVVQELETKKLLKEDQGAMIVDLGPDMVPALIKRSDGATLYITRDLAAVFYRMREYHFSKALYVVGNEQRLHFQQLRSVIDLMGYDYSSTIEHVNFGLVLQNGKKMSTRQGKVVTLYEVLMTAIEYAKQAIEQKNPSLENKDEIAKQIGIGAVMFNDLKNHRTLDIEFDLPSMVKFEGQTGPYLQYTGVRIASMLRENDFDINDMDEMLFDKEHYYDVIKTVSHFGVTISRAMEDNAPSVIAKYLLGLAQSFNKFYALEKILVDDDKIRNANLAVSAAVRIVLDEGMRLLGIKSLERM